MAGSSAASEGEFLLFFEGMPQRDAGPAAGRMNFSANFVGGLSLGTATWGGTEPGDFAADQAYGGMANIARMVLDIAGRLGVPIRAIDVGSPDADGGLRRRFVTPDTDLPLLVRSDGAKLAGTESFVPKTVREFLLGR